MSLRVLLIDDHTLFRVGLEGLLAHRSIEVIASIGDGREGLQRAEELKPDVVLLDMRMPDINGIGVLRKLRESGFKNPIVMLTTSTDERDLVESLRNGAQGYLLKDMEPVDLLASVRNAAQGRTVLSEKLIGLLVQAIREDSRPKSTGEAGLTEQEQRVLEELATGKSNKMIARALDISDGTVKVHVKHILKKLNLRSRIEAAVWALGKKG